MENILLIDESRGIYVHKQFAIHYRDNILGVDNPKYYDIMADLDILKEGPDHEEYLDAWDEVIDLTTIDIDGVKYVLSQDGDLWGIPKF